MDIVWHTIYLEHLVFIGLKYTCYILMQPLFPFLLDKCLPVFNCKHKLNMKLGITICHS